MAIEITEFANVSISVSPTGVSGGNFGILGFLTDDTDSATNPIGTAERSRAYTSLAAVAADWPATTEVYKAATAFYAQTPTPTDFVVLMSFSSNQVATLTGGNRATLAELVANHTGSGNITMTIDGVEAVVTTLDLSGAADYDAVATAVQAALTTAGATCTVENGPYGFTVKGDTAGAAGSITFATGDAAEDLGLLAYQGVIAQGLDAETVVEGLTATHATGVEFVGLVLNKKWRDVLSGAVGETTLEVAQWAEAAKKIFCNTTNDLSVLNSAITTDIASKCKDATLRFTLTTFSKNPAEYPSASVFGRAASVNFSAIGTTITLNLKQMPGISAEDLTPAEFGVLRSKYASAVVVIGKSVSAYTDSRMASGSWLDTTHGLLWLENRCETDLFNLLYVNNTKVPFTQAGINTVVGVLQRSLQAAVRNGLAGPGYLADGTFLPEGFRVDSVPLADVPAGDLGNRLYAGLSFVMKGAGALHEVDVAGQFSE